MGIKNLNPFLKEICPDAFQNLPYSFFTGKRVAVDSDNILRKLMSRAHKEIVNQTDVCSQEPDRKEIFKTWMFHIREEILKFLNFGITLIFVFDGKYIDEKSETQKKRREEKQKRIQEAKELKDKIMAIDELERTPHMVTELRQKMHHLGTITPEEKEFTQDILRALGFPVLIATEEGEKLCGMLCVEGKVDAVYSRDTDLVALGCPIVINEEAGWIYNSSTKKQEKALKCTVFKPILAALNISYSTFVDLCIMAGCDFNSNIKKLAVKTAYKLLKQCNSIDNLDPKYDEKKEILNHQRCREIFSQQKSNEICQHEIVLDIDKNCLSSLSAKNTLQQFGIETDWIDDLKYYYSILPQPSACFIGKQPSISSSKLRLKIMTPVNSSMNIADKQTSQTISEVKVVSEPSPPKLTNNMITSLNQQQILRYKEKLALTSTSTPSIITKLKIVN